MTTVAKLHPLTYKDPPVAAIIMLAVNILWGHVRGIDTSILINLPGETASVETCIDGYNGAAGACGRALTNAAVGSFLP
jgi:TctA family transporter